MLNDDDYRALNYAMELGWCALPLAPAEREVELRDLVENVSAEGLSEQEYIDKLNTYIMASVERALPNRYHGRCYYFENEAVDPSEVLLPAEYEIQDDDLPFIRKVLAEVAETWR